MRKTARQHRSVDLVEAILEATSRLWRERGRPPSANAISRRAGVSPGSFYQYFQDAQDAYAELAARSWYALEASIIGATAPLPSLADAARRATATYLSWSTERAPSFPWQRASEARVQLAREALCTTLTRLARERGAGEAAAQGLVHAGTTTAEALIADGCADSALIENVIAALSATTAGHSSSL